jgi:hypothetical protein
MTASKDYETLQYWIDLTVLTVRGLWIDFRLWLRHHREKIRMGGNVLIMVGVLMIALMGMPPFVGLTVAVVAQNHDRQQRDDTLTPYRILQLELARKSTDEKVDMLVLAVQQLRDDVAAGRASMNDRQDSNRWWVGTCFVVLGLLLNLPALIGIIKRRN